jgi:hypothetical protein
MSYQAVIRDASNELVASQSVGMQISILQGSASGTSVYTETQTASTNDNGLVSIIIGEGTTNDDFSNIDWAEGPYFVKTETDPNGVSDYSIIGTTQLLSVPYAMHAKIAETVTNDNDQQQLSVSATGDTLYLQNGGFIIMPGISAANTPSYPQGTVHCTVTPTAVVDVTNPTTGQTWMDRNLGATQAATSSTDSLAYGDLYQWGRAADGHQCRNSATTTTLSSTDEPGHDDFITSGFGSNYDWRSPQNDNLWQGANGINNPCPSGYRLPTNAELDAEHESWSSDDAAGAFSSPLKLPVAGFRSSNGSLYSVGSYGSYWSSRVDGTVSNYLDFFSFSANMDGSYRANSISVRCLKDSDGDSGNGDDTGDNTELPTITTASITSITDSSAVTGGTIDTNGGAVITASGVVWDTVSNPTLDSNLGVTIESATSGSFVSNITGLSASTTYYVKAYATNSEGTAYAVEDTFTTTSSGGGEMQFNIWQGTEITFTKSAGADPTLKANQDSITPSVSITRGNSGGEIYNIIEESQSSKGSSPSGTEWAIGEIAEIENLNFASFRSAVGSPKQVVGKSLVLHIINEDVYISVEFKSWGQGRNGDFSYERSTQN